MNEHEEGPLLTEAFDEICAHPHYAALVLELLNLKILDLRNGTTYFESKCGAAGEFLANASEQAAQKLQRDRDMLRAAIDKRKE